MRVLFHRTKATEFGNQLLDTVNSVVKDGQVHVTDDIEALTSALLNYRLLMPTVVIQVGQMADIVEIDNLKDLLDGLFLIMAADDDDEALLLRCRQLYPRLLTYRQEDLGVIAAVIEKRQSRPHRYNTAPMADGPLPTDSLKIIHHRKKFMRRRNVARIPTVAAVRTA